jgi:hypothetical protein
MDEALDILTLLEAARLLRCSKAHISNLVNGRIAGVPPLPVVPLGRRKLIRRSSLYAWIGANEQSSRDVKIRPSRSADLRERA